MVEGISEGVDVAALPGGVAEHFADGRGQPVVVVADYGLDAVQSAPAESDEEVLPAAAAFAVGRSTPKAMSTAWERMTPLSRTFS